MKRFMLGLSFAALCLGACNKEDEKEHTGNNADLNDIEPGIKADYWTLKDTTYTPRYVRIDNDTVYASAGYPEDILQIGFRRLPDQMGKYFIVRNYPEDYEVSIRYVSGKYKVNENRFYVSANHTMDKRELRVDIRKNGDIAIGSENIQVIREYKPDPDKPDIRYDTAYISFQVTAKAQSGDTGL